MKKQELSRLLARVLVLSVMVSCISFISVIPMSAQAEETYTGQFICGDFEGTDEEIKSHWYIWDHGWCECFRITDEENHTPGGSKCLAVDPKGGAWQAVSYHDENEELGIEIIPGAIYEISYWHKGAANGQFQIADYGIPEQNIPCYSQPGVDDADWTFYSKKFVANGRTRFSPIDFKNTLGEGDIEGTSYIDDLKIEMVSPPQTPRPPKELTEDETLAEKHENMEIGTNFWFHTYWSGCTPIKSIYSPASESNPNGATDEDWQKAYDYGKNIWNETFVKEIEPFTTLRFMDWGNTNGSTIVSWDQRRLPGDKNNYDIGMDPNNASGLAYEWMIDLCNRYDKNCWICLPSSADDNYIRQLAILCKKNLNPSLKLYLEYSNEVWNYGFQQYFYAEEMGQKTTEIGLTEDTKFDGNYSANYYVYRSFQMFDIFEEIYGIENMGTQCIRVIATSGNTAIFDAAYNNVFYSKDVYNKNDQRADYLAVAPYVGAGLDGFDVDIEYKFHDAIDSTLDSYVKSCYNLAKKYGLPLIAYEGGQHLLLGANAWSANQNIYNQYIYMLNKFAPYFDLYCHYCLTGAWGSGGAWGANSHTGQDLSEAPKLRALYDWIAADTTEYSTLSFAVGCPGNASFQDGMDYWETDCDLESYEIINDSEDPVDAGHPHYFQLTNTTDKPCGGSYVQTSFYLEPGETYHLKYNISATNSETGSWSLLDVAVMDWATNLTLGSKNWGSGGDGGWADHIIDFTVPAEGNGLVKLRFATSAWNVSSIIIKFDNVRVWKDGEEEPTDTQYSTDSYMYQPQPLDKVTPFPRITPTPTVKETEEPGEHTPKPSSAPSDSATAPDMNETPSDANSTPDTATSTPDITETPSASATDTPGLTDMPSASATDAPNITDLPSGLSTAESSAAANATAPVPAGSSSPHGTAAVTEIPSAGSSVVPDNITIKFKKKKVTIRKGRKKTLKVKLAGAKKARFKLKNKKMKKIVKIVKKKAKKVVIKAKKKGKAVVIAKAGGRKAKCKVIVR